MGPMLLLVVAIGASVGFTLFQLGEMNRFEMVSDQKRGGVYVIDRKTASVNYCTHKSCMLVGNGSLPSQAIGNPAVLASMQNSIMGAPAVVTASEGGEVPDGMKKNMASAGAQKPLAADPTAHVKKADGSDDGEEADSADEAPEEFNFN